MVITGLFPGGGGGGGGGRQARKLDRGSRQGRHAGELLLLVAAAWQEGCLSDRDDDDEEEEEVEEGNNSASPSGENEMRGGPCSLGLSVRDGRASRLRRRMPATARAIKMPDQSIARRFKFHFGGGSGHSLAPLHWAAAAMQLSLPRKYVLTRRRRRFHHIREGIAAADESSMLARASGKNYRASDRWFELRRPSCLPRRPAASVTFRESWPYTMFVTHTGGK